MANKKQKRNRRAYLAANSANTTNQKDGQTTDKNQVVLKITRRQVKWLIVFALLGTIRLGFSWSQPGQNIVLSKIVVQISNLIHSADSSEDNVSKSDLTRVKNWNADIYDELTTATRNVTYKGDDDEQEIITYTDGSKYADLVEKVGKPDETSSYTDKTGTSVTADWETPVSEERRVNISIDYDKKSGLITDKSYY